MSGQQYGQGSARSHQKSLQRGKSCKPALDQGRKSAQLNRNKTEQNYYSTNPELERLKIQNKNVMQQLVEANHRYLTDKMKVPKDGRPSAYQHKLPTTTYPSQYRNKFAKKTIQNSHKSLRKEQKPKESPPFISPKCDREAYKSTYDTTYKGRQTDNDSLLKRKGKNPEDQRVDIAKRDVPMFCQTSYNNTYLNWGGKATVQSMRPNQCKLMGGGHLNAKSVYRNDFGHTNNSMDSKTNKNRAAPFCPVDNHIFITLDTPYKSCYQDNFNSDNYKKAVKETPLKPQLAKSSNALMSKTAYNSEYQMQFKEKKTPEPTSQYDWSKLNTKQLTELIMHL